MVYLNEACVEALQLYLAKRNTMEGLNPKEKAVFVTRRRRERISNRRWSSSSPVHESGRLKGFSTHKLRHTAATLMYQTGNVDILTLKQLLGHSSVVQRKFIRICRNFRCVLPLSRTRWVQLHLKKHAWIQQNGR